VHEYGGWPDPCKSWLGLLKRGWAVGASLCVNVYVGFRGEVVDGVDFEGEGLERLSGGDGVLLC
jgi:hypothetical protein